MCRGIKHLTHIKHIKHLGNEGLICANTKGIRQKKKLFKKNNELFSPLISLFKFDVCKIVFS